MKLSLRSAFLNKYILLAFILAFAIPFLSWAIFSEYFMGLWVWDTSPVPKAQYMDLIFKYENYADDGFMLLQLAMPLLAALISLPFLNNKNILCLSYTRVKSYRKTVVFMILKYLLIGCTVLYCAYIVFLYVGTLLLTTKPDLNNDAVILFTEFFGADFYYNNLFSYFAVEGIIKFFIFPFVYGLFSIAVSFITSKKYVCLLAPILYYNVVSIIVAIIQSATGKEVLMYISPTYTVVPGCREYINIFVVLAPLLIPLLFSVVVIGKNLCKGFKEDSYAIS